MYIIFNIFFFSPKLTINITKIYCYTVFGRHSNQKQKDNALLSHIKLNEKKQCRYQCDRVKEVKLILTPIVYIYIYSGKIDIKTVHTQQQQQQQTTNKKNKQNKYKKQNEAKNYKTTTKTKLKQNITKSK